MVVHLGFTFTSKVEAVTDVFCMTTERQWQIGRGEFD